MSGKELIEEKLAVINNRLDQLRRTRGSPTEIFSLQQQANQLRVSLLDINEGEEDAKEGKEEKEEKEYANILKLCNTLTDITGDKFKENKTTMIMLPDSLIMECYSRNDIHHILNPAYQLYEWNNNDETTLCCPIKTKPIFILPISQTFVDHSASLLSMVKISKLEFVGEIPIGSDVIAEGSSVSAIHGRKTKIYRIVPLDPVKLIPDIPILEQINNKKLTIPVDEKYEELKRQYNTTNEQLNINMQGKNKIVIDKLRNRIIRLRNVISPYAKHHSNLEQIFRRNKMAELNQAINKYTILPKYYINRYIHELLKLDGTFRYEGITGDLFTLKDFNFMTDFYKITNEIPCIRNERILESLSITNSIDAFIEHFITNNGLATFIYDIIKIYNDPIKLIFEQGDAIVIARKIKLNDVSVDEVELYAQFLNKKVSFIYSIAANNLHRLGKLLKIENADGSTYDVTDLIATKINNNTISLELSDTAFKLVNYILTGDPRGNNTHRNMIIAGGSVFNAIKDTKVSSDIDYFIYGLTPEQATIKISEFINNLNKYGLKIHNITKSLNCITLNTISALRGSLTIQFILRIYNHPSEILHGFDIGSAAVGFDGKDVYFTSLSKFANEFNANIIDTTRRSTTYEARLLKYVNRNCSIILPNLNFNKYVSYLKEVDNFNTSVLFPLGKFYEYKVDNKILINTHYAYHSEPDSDYDLEYDNDLIFHYLLTKQYDKIAVRTISSSLDNIYSGINLELLYTKLKRLIEKAHERFYIDIHDNKPALAVYKLKNMLVDYKKILELVNNGKLYSQEMRDILTHNNKLLVYSINDFISKYKNTLTIKWMTKNAMTQLTSSFNPIISDAKDWYGSFYTSVDYGPGYTD